MSLRPLGISNRALDSSKASQPTNPKLKRPPSATSQKANDSKLKNVNSYFQESQNIKHQNTNIAKPADKKVGNMRRTLSSVLTDCFSQVAVQSRPKKRESLSPIRCLKKYGNPSPIKEVDEHSCTNSDGLHDKFQEVFDSLDAKKVGYLDKFNCQIQSLPDQLRFLLGPVLSKVRYQAWKLTEQEFVNLCKDTLIFMSSVQVDRILKWCPQKSSSCAPSLHKTGGKKGEKGAISRSQNSSLIKPSRQNGFSHKSTTQSRCRNILVPTKASEACTTKLHH